MSSLKGFRTIIVNLLMALASILAVYNIEIPPEMIEEIATGVVSMYALVNLVMRAMTTTPSEPTFTGGRPGPPPIATTDGHSRNARCTRHHGPTGPTAYALAPGTYTVRVEKPGYEPWESRVVLAAGERETVRAGLQPESTVPANRPPALAM